MDGDAYRPQLRQTATRGKFGGSSSPKNLRGGDVTQILESLQKDINQYSSYVDALGTSLDTQERREESKQLRASIKEKLQAANQKLQERVSRGKSDVALKRLSDQLDSLLNQFKRLTNLEKTKMDNGTAESHLTDSFAGSEQNVSEMAGDVHEQDQVVAPSNLDILEKQAGDMRNLERDIKDLNEITIDLNTMVNEQGEAIDRIEHHTEKAATRVEKATAHTTAAVSLRRDNRTMLFIILLIAGIVVGIVVIVVIVLASVLATR